MSSNALDQPRITSILGRVDSALGNGLLPALVFNDEEVFQAELEQVFGRSWVFLAHESEVPRPGDYVLRSIGRDQVIVSRDENGQLNVLLNNCRHRGTSVCNDDSGNTSHFRCPYHGWTYSNDGSWVGAAHKKRAYQELDSASWGLLRAPHVDTYLGMIFGNLEPAAPPLIESLGPMAWYLKAIFGLDSRGTEVMGQPLRWISHTDWKSGSENFGGDNYHTDQAHISIEEMGLGNNYRKHNNYMLHIEAGNGHTLTASDMKGELNQAEMNPWSYPDEVWKAFDFEGVEQGQLDLLAQYSPNVGNIFPNLSFIRATALDPDTGKRDLYTSLRQWQPLGPGRCEVWSWQLRWRVEPDEIAERNHAATVYRFGPAGVFEQDDMAVWEGAPKAAASVFGRAQSMDFNYQLGKDGMSVGEYLADWKAPGTARTTGYGEGNQRSFYRRWLAAMRGEVR